MNSGTVSALISAPLRSKPPAVTRDRATTTGASITPISKLTNADLVLIPSGAGALIVGPSPDSTTLGGNTRGQYAVDLQPVRGAATRIASGANSFTAGYDNTASAQYTVAVGYGNIANSFAAQAFGYGSIASNYYATAIGNGATASGQSSIALGRTASVTGYGAYSFGNNNTTSGNYATSLGNYSKADRNYMYSFACGQFAAVGDAQEAKWVLRAVTANNTPTEAFVDGSSVRVTIPSNKAIAGRVMVLGKKASSSSVAKYFRQFVAVNNAGTSTLAQSETIGTDYEDNASCNFALTVSDANDALIFTVTGITSETWRWVIMVDAVEVSN